MLVYELDGIDDKRFLVSRLVQVLLDGKLQTPLFLQFQWR